VVHLVEAGLHKHVAPEIKHGPGVPLEAVRRDEYVFAKLGAVVRESRERHLHPHMRGAM
jgi:hypothetical protein